MHIPKTAGSSLADAFCFTFDHFIRDGHLPQNNWRQVIQGPGSFFVSGHFRYEQVADMIDRPDVYCLTVLRDPVEHVVSHMRWVKAYGDPARAEERARLSPAFADMAIRLWQTPLSDVDAVRQVVGSPSEHMFSSVQTKLLAAPETHQDRAAAVASALARLERFNFFCAVEDLGPAMEVLDAEVGPLEPLKTTNTALIDDAPDFGSAPVAAFYGDFITYDLELYAAAKARSRERFGL